MAARRYILTLAFLLSLATGSLAQLAPEEIPADPDAEVVDEVRYYSVEVIVFEYSDLASAGNEIFDPEPAEDSAAFDTLDDGTPGSEPAFGDARTGLPDGPGVAGGDGSGAFDSVDSGDVDIDIEEVPSLHNVGFRRLTPAEMTMNSIHDKLVRLDAYKPLFWGGWLQQAVDESMTLPVRLRMLGITPIDLDGQLTLYSRNYLHLVVDLTLQQQMAPIVPEYRQQNPRFDRRGNAADNRNLFGTGGWQTIRYHISEDRIFNSGHLRYFDHPKFGALVRINRIETPDDIDTDPASPALPRTDAE